MKAWKEAVLYSMCVLLGVSLGCGVKGPPTPYIDIETGPSAAAQPKKNLEVKSTGEKGSNIP